MQENSAMRKLPPYLFARIEKKIEEAKEKGVDIISLGIGDPDQPTPQHIIERAAQALRIRPTTSIPVQSGCCHSDRRWLNGIAGALELTWIPGRKWYP